MSSPPSTATFRLVGDVKFDAASALEGFEIRFSGVSDSVQATDEADNSLTLFPWFPVTLDFSILDNQPIFVDDFESGDTSAWSTTVP